MSLKSKSDSYNFIKISKKHFSEQFIGKNGFEKCHPVQEIFHKNSFSLCYYYVCMEMILYSINFKFIFFINRSTSFVHSKLALSAILNSKALPQYSLPSGTQKCRFLLFLTEKKLLCM